MRPPRTGLGWDVHRTGEGQSIWLGGVEIPSSFGLVGHSDADVLSHAITDALLGAAALGDIGVHFPDTDPRWKGAASGVFLEHAARLLRDRGYEIANIDSTVILQRPRLKNHRTAIREKLAATLQIPIDCVNVKFKTAEELGPAGEGLGVEAQAIATIFAAR